MRLPWRVGLVCAATGFVAVLVIGLIRIHQEGASPTRSWPSASQPPDPLALAAKARCLHAVQLRQDEIAADPSAAPADRVVACDLDGSAARIEWWPSAAAARAALPILDAMLAAEGGGYYAMGDCWRAAARDRDPIVQQRVAKRMALRLDGQLVAVLART